MTKAEEFARARTFCDSRSFPVSAELAAATTEIESTRDAV